MKQGDLIKLDITSLGSNGEGVGKIGDSYVYVKNAIDGERISARVAYAKKNVVFAAVKEVSHPSDDRRQPKCEKFLKCGGCQLQHLTYQKQLEFKRQQVKQNLSKIGGIDIDVPPIVPCENEWGYRNKVQLPVSKVCGKPVVGFFEDNSHKIVPVSDCPLQNSWAKDMAEIFLQYLQKFNVDIYDERSHSGLVRHLIGRFVDGQLLVTVVINGTSLPNVDYFCKLLDKQFAKWGLFVNINTAKTNVILGDKSTWIAGQKFIKSQALGVEFCLRPDSFFQVNYNIMQKLYFDAKKLLSQNKTEVLIDCFSGIGVLSACLYSPDVKEYAIEIVNDAFLDAEQIKKINNLTNLTNICGDVAVQLPKIIDDNPNKNIAVVLDPPRKGLAPSTISLLQKTLPSQIIYISCDSATLSRDLKQLLLDNQYQISSLKVYDMFPQTKHVETLVCLARK